MHDTVFAALLLAGVPAMAKAGALCFGLLIGWYAYFINRWRKDVVIGDLATVVGAVGGAAILKLFPGGSELFGYYGVGLAIGFFGYLLLLLLMIWRSPKYTIDFFLVPPEGQHPLGPRGDSGLEH